MQNKSDDSDTLEELIEVGRELNALIEDNNQNIKDCFKILRKIEYQVCPKKPSLFSRVIAKILNTHKLL